MWKITAYTSTGSLKSARYYVPMASVQIEVNQLVRDESVVTIKIERYAK